MKFVLPVVLGCLPLRPWLSRLPRSSNWMDYRPDIERGLALRVTIDDRDSVIVALQQQAAALRIISRP